MTGRPSAAKRELAPLLAELRRTHDILPFLESQIGSQEAEFRPLPDEMADLLATSPDFRMPLKGSGAVWVQCYSDGNRAVELIVARTLVDGRLWVIAPIRTESENIGLT